MITSSSRIRGIVPLALSIGLLVVPQAGAHRGRGGHGGGGHGGGAQPLDSPISPHASRCITHPECSRDSAVMAAVA